jgi:hypothetical protein
MQAGLGICGSIKSISCRNGWQSTSQQRLGNTAEDKYMLNFSSTNLAAWVGHFQIPVYHQADGHWQQV